MSGSSLPEALEQLLGKHPGFEVRVREISYAWKNKLPRIKGRFFYLSFSDGLPTLQEFAEYLKRELVPFCIPRRERTEVHAEVVKNIENQHLVVALFEKARNLFIKANKEQKRIGEAGELILFLFLEKVMGAPQVVSKMYLKTSGGMPVHGTDGIHIGYDAGSDELLVYWGESKLYEQFSSALGAVITSVTDFLNADLKKNREIQIIRDHIDLGETNDALKKQLLAYFDPYEEKSLKRREVFACFIGFDLGIYEKLKTTPPSEVEKLFCDEYLKRIASACELISEKLNEGNLQHINFDFFLLPFPSVTEFRVAFYKAIGWNDD